MGPQRAELLAKLGLFTARDVLFFFPRDYQDLSDLRDVPALEEGKLQSVRGVVEDVELRGGHSGRSILGVLVHAASGHLRALWFNQPWMREKFTLGQQVLVSGKPKLEGLMWEMVHPRVEALGEDEPDPPGRILPIYPATEGLLQWQIRRIVQETVQAYGGVLDEVFPEAFLQAHALMPLRRALPEIHAPESRQALEEARRRFIYQELFILQLALVLRRQQQRAGRQAPRLEATPLIDARIRRLFPFTLTAAQDQAVAQIAADMASPVPMNRLLQGDVGSGKTVVALYGMLLAVAHRYQAVLMAPTEVLARQHAVTLERLLAGSEVRRVQLTGGMTAKARTEALIKIAAGEVDLVIGTQAVIQEDVQFRKLGLVVIDEQHKFGVRQRASLKQAGSDPHYLVMTATPIPRSITMTLFGDLELSALRDSPPGRQKVHTYLVDDTLRPRWWKFFGEKLREGRQGYVVVPLVEESEQSDIASVEETFESLANGPLEPFRLELIHGRMSTAEKDAVMDGFRGGRDAGAGDHFRGGGGRRRAQCHADGHRGGRTFWPGPVAPVARPHQPRQVSRLLLRVFPTPKTEDSHERLKAFASTTDGFRLAEIDFKLRGPGDMLGTRQHGLPPLRIADLLRDAAMLEEARRDAEALLTLDPGLAQADNARLRRMTVARYGRVLELGDVG